METNPVVLASLFRKRAYLFLLVAADLALLAALSGLSLDPYPAAPAFLGFDVAFVGFRPGPVLLLILLHAVALLAAARGERQRLEKLAVQIHPADRSGGRRYGPFSAPEIVAAVLDRSRRSGRGRVSRIYLLPQPIPNAYTARYPGLGDVVVLHTNLFDFLTPDGVRAVIAHEVGHIRWSDSLARQVLRVPGLVATILFFLLLFQIVGGLLVSRSAGEAALRAGFLFLALAGVRAASTGIGHLALRAARESEHLADAHAGRLEGLEVTANMLLLLSERTEALVAIQETLGELVRSQGEPGEPIDPRELERVLARFPRGELDEAIARRLAPELLIAERLDRLRRSFLVPLAEEEVARLAREGAEALRAAAAESARESPSEPVVRWRTFDLDRSGHLDRRELAELVLALEKDPGRMLFRQFLDPASRRREHPPARDRILFLHRAIEAEETG